ncbi:MAG: hypothetical protein IKZ58_01205 [Selenomonadaceae bacterium]|nr:hypothetical protein [Selenomonadaceae bacterium]
MKYKIFFCAVLAIIFSMSSVTFAASSAYELLSRIERDTYGVEREGAILQRINRLEKDYSGRNLQEDMNTRIEALYTIIYDNSATPGVMAKINALEWNIAHEVKIGGIKERIGNLEKTLLGEENDGTINDRLHELVKMSFSSEDIPMYEIQLPADTLIKISLVDGVGTRTAQVGDAVRFRVAEDVIVGGNLVFAKGLYGVGVVDTVKKPNGWGSNGKLNINFYKVNCMDGQEIDTCVDYAAMEIMAEKKMVLGAAIVGMDLNDDWNRVLVHGKNLEAPAGTELYIQIKNNVAVYALKGGRGSLTINDTTYDVDDDDDFLFKENE